MKECSRNSGRRNAISYPKQLILQPDKALISCAWTTQCWAKGQRFSFSEDRAETTLLQSSSIDTQLPRDLITCLCLDSYFFHHTSCVLCDSCCLLLQHSEQKSSLVFYPSFFRSKPFSLYCNTLLLANNVIKLVFDIFSKAKHSFNLYIFIISVKYQGTSAYHCPLE